MLPRSLRYYLRWPLVLRSTHERSVAALKEEIRSLRQERIQATLTNSADIAEFVVRNNPGLQEELRKHRDEFLGKRGP